jgi:hypothetical protein
MQRGFSASLLKRPNVDAAHLLDCAPIEILLIVMNCRSEANLINRALSFRGH